jgi:acetyl/propionyl-CoA carboxylase alpha subunit
MFRKILIANRGEIAVRIISSARKLGIHTVAVYAADDAGSLHVQIADEACLLPGVQLGETYLNRDLIISLALLHKAEAIHPGYGFLSEDALFAAKVEEAGLAFIGATPGQINLMGEKTKAIGFVKSLNIPVIPGKYGTKDELLHNQETLFFPLLVKAAAGGGGKGMQVVERAADLPEALQKASRQAEEYFGNGTLFLEKYLPGARHIEVQVMGDGRGEVVHLYERECSTQRRYQKLIEESPALSVSIALKERLYEYALRVAKAIRYRGAGTIEFLVDRQENCYFLEMNTRLQVEHPVTECVTGQDLVEWQLKIAAGKTLPLIQSDIKQLGHAIEARVCAEDPSNGFKPSCGVIQPVYIPDAVRWDSFITEKMNLPATYDSLIGKLIVHGHSREEAVDKLKQALQRLVTGGLKTNQLFLLQIIQSGAFRTNKMTTCFLGEQVADLLNLSDEARKAIPVERILAAYLVHRYYRPEEEPGLWFNAGYWRIRPVVQVEMNNISYRFSVLKRNRRYELRFEEKRSELSDVWFNGERIGCNVDGHFFEAMVFDNRDITVVHYQGHQFNLISSGFGSRTALKKQKDFGSDAKPLKIVSGLFGKVVDVLIEPGDRLIKGQNLLIIESMKMEFTIQSPGNATVKTVHVSKGKMVHDTEILVDLES